MFVVFVFKIRLMLGVFFFGRLLMLWWDIYFSFIDILCCYVLLVKDDVS